MEKQILRPERYILLVTPHGRYTGIYYLQKEVSLVAFVLKIDFNVAHCISHGNVFDY